MRRMVVTVLALAFVGCAQHRIPPVAPIYQTRFGPDDAPDFGPGITSVGPDAISFVVDVPAHVIVLRVTTAGGIEQVQPRRSGDHSEVGAGTHLVRASAGVTAGYDERPAVERAAVQNTRFVCPSPWEADPTRAPDPSAARDTTGRAIRSAAVAQRRYQDCVRREAGSETIFRPQAESLVGYWLVIASDVSTSAPDLAQRLQPMDSISVDLEEVVRSLPDALVASRTGHWAAYYVAVPRPGSH